MFEEKWIGATVWTDADALVGHTSVPFEKLVEYFERRLQERFPGFDEGSKTDPEQTAQSLTYKHVVDITNQGVQKYSICIYLDRVGSAESPLAGETLIVLGRIESSGSPRWSKDAKKADGLLKYLREPLDDEVNPWDSASVKWVEDNRGWKLRRLPFGR